MSFPFDSQFINSPKQLLFSNSLKLWNIILKNTFYLIKNKKKKTQPPPIPSLPHLLLDAHLLDWSACCRNNTIEWWGYRTAFGTSLKRMSTGRWHFHSELPDDSDLASIQTSIKCGVILIGVPPELLFHFSSQCWCKQQLSLISVHQWKPLILHRAGFRNTYTHLLCLV